MTALMASVVLRYRAMQARPGAPTNAAIVSYASSNRAVISREARDCPRWTLSYPGPSVRYSSSSSRGGWVLAALFVGARPISGNVKCRRIRRTSSGSDMADDLTVELTQEAAAELPGGIPRDLLDDHDVAQPLVRRDPLGHPGGQRRRVELAARDDVGHGHLAARR